MSSSPEIFRNHPVFASLQSLANALGLARELAQRDTASQEGLERVSILASYIRQSLEGIAPPFTSSPTLDRVNHSLIAATNGLTAFATSGATQQLAVANNNAENALAQLQRLSLINFFDPARLPENFGEKFRALERERTELATSLSVLKAEVADFPNQISAFRVRAEQVFLQTTGEFNAKTERLLEQYRVKLEQHGANLSKLRDEQMLALQSLESFRKDTTSQLSTLAQQCTEQIGHLRDRLEKEITAQQEKLIQETLEKTNQLQSRTETALSDKLSHIESNYVTRAKEVVLLVENHAREAEKLVGIIGNRGVTSGYQKAADRSLRTKWLWQALAVLSMGGLIFMAIKVFLPMTKEEVSWAAFAGRVFVSMTIGVLAAYSARQADKAYESERRNRRIELELASIGPYLASLSIENQEKFKLLMAKRTFGRDEQADFPRERASPATTIDVAEELLKSERFKELIKAATDSLKEK